MWHSRPLNELFSNLSRPLKEALCSWLRADTPQNLTTVYVTDERQAAVFSPLFKRPYQFRAITEITRSAEEGNKQIISPDQLDCAFMELKLEHDSEFESWDRFQAFCMPPGVRVRMQISDFEEDAYEAGEDYDGFDDYSGLSTTWGARPLHGHSLMAALFPPADIMDIDGHQ
ncbi:hypothetical protein BJY00DRAFT_282004 [Aspergillus carlsbadensis]|nr:hypothetical protein BJY00DRAFT_282004 [Aspergillus carlsbadensis]